MVKFLCILGINNLRTIVILSVLTFCPCALFSTRFVDTSYKELSGQRPQTLQIAAHLKFASFATACETESNCPSTVLWWRRGRSLLQLARMMDAIATKIIRPHAVSAILRRSCRHWHGMLRCIQTDVSFMNAAGCFDIVRSIDQK